MILLWLLIGLALAIFIARLNESNKLFWVCFTSFALGIAGASIYTRLTSQSEKELTQVHSTQEVTDASSIGYFVADVPDTVQCPAPNPVGQNVLEPCEKNFALSECHVDTTEKPPTLKHD